jgi:hypothetical protein
VLAPQAGEHFAKQGHPPTSLVASGLSAPSQEM